ncbi:transcriptional regulator, MerR family [Candidatus Koribacter versatilis Ellin345]|uniref:Transcriptional regulator, MerR family n=1 Tax=Koribacter versatilis (strain Ellin345) TaxID=204669 RepID=Q1IRF9_KORVE|nr:cupin domain-containing protein [Candidatus Koribacter versatilis]ABF40541.1 transcriptional regulator, MerR family [Candidatus Koribacter versatilis Ellin345]
MATKNSIRSVHKNGGRGVAIVPADAPANANDAPLLKIGEVADTVGISASVIRSWEKLGLIAPQRTGSKYRLYSQEDVRLLQRARYLSRVRGMNAPAIIELMRTKGEIKASRNGSADNVGLRLRLVRTSRGLSLAQVAEAVGISVGFLSAIERSAMSASVATLRKLAKFYKLNILDLFDQSGGRQYLVRPAERRQLDASDGVRMELLAWGNPVMEPHLFHVAPGAGSGDEEYSHEGEEFLFVLTGLLNLVVDGKEYRLQKGDSFYFESSTPHRWSNTGSKEAVVLWVNTPPTF